MLYVHSHNSCSMVFLAFNARSKILPNIMSGHNIGSYVDIDSFSLHFLYTR